MNNENEKINIEVEDLTQKEKELIYFLRNRFKWGDILIEMRNGQPFRMSKTTEYQTLG